MPTGDGTTIGLTILALGEQPLDQRQGKAGGAIFGGETQIDLAASPEEIRKPFQGAMKNGLGASFRKATIVGIFGRDGAQAPVGRSANGLGQDEPADLGHIKSAGLEQGVNRRTPDAGTSPNALQADKGYDAMIVHADLAKRNIEAVIPRRSNRRVKIKHDRKLYKTAKPDRALLRAPQVSCAIPTRYDQFAASFSSMVNIATVRYCLKSVNADQMFGPGI